MARYTKKYMFSLKTEDGNLASHEVPYLPLRKREKIELLGEDAITNDAIGKLSALEDLEKELGIDLITFYKALKEGIYIKDGYRGYKEADKKWAIVSVDNKVGYYHGDIEAALFEREEVVKNKLYGYTKYYEYCPFDEIDTSKVRALWKSTLVKIEDYGKTWALTKEELE